MTARELIEKLNNLPESHKDLPIVVDSGSKQRSTYRPDTVHMGLDECGRQSIIIEHN